MEAKLEVNEELVPVEGIDDGSLPLPRVVRVVKSRAPHPVFGPVPKGRLILTVVTPSFDDKGIRSLRFKDRCFDADAIRWHEENADPEAPTTVMEVAGASWCQHVVKQTPAEVSRLIAEAQGDG